MRSDMTDYNIEEKMVRKMELRLQGRSTLGLGRAETTDGQDSMDKAQMLAANRSALAAMHKSHYLNTEWKVVSRKRVLGKPIVFIKRLIRKGVRWYVRPPIMQQSEFNRNSLTVIKNLQEIVLDQQQTIQRLREEQAQTVQALHEQMALLDQVLVKNHRFMDAYQPYLDVLLERVRGVDEELQE